MTTTASQSMTTQKHNGHKRPGARQNNQNRTTHGLRSRDAMRYGLTNVAFPKGCHRIAANVNAWRRSVEDAVTAARGAISVVDSATINRAVRSEAFARLASRHLARKGDDMAPETWLAFKRDAERSTIERDRALADLNLESKTLASLFHLANGSVDA